MTGQSCTQADKVYVKNDQISVIRLLIRIMLSKCISPKPALAQ